MYPDWFIGKKPTVGEQYRGKARNNANKWWNMVINVVNTFDNEGTTIYTVEVVSVTEIGELPTGGAAGQILSKKTAADYDTQWIDAPQSGGTDLTAGDGLTITGGVASVDTPVKSILTQAEYDALPEAEQNKGMYVISDGGSGGSSVGGSSESLDIYSTEETRIGTWIDGKPLYRSVFVSNGFVSNGNHDMPGVENANLAFCYGNAIWSGAPNIRENIPYAAASSTSSVIRLKSNSGKLQVSTNIVGGQTVKFEAVFYYTKTTDQPEVTA